MFLICLWIGFLCPPENWITQGGVAGASQDLFVVDRLYHSRSCRRGFLCRSFQELTECDWALSFAKSKATNLGPIMFLRLFLRGFRSRGMFLRGCYSAGIALHGHRRLRNSYPHQPVAKSAIQQSFHHGNQRV